MKRLLALALATISACGGKETPDAADATVASTTDGAPPIAPACMNAQGGCRDECVTPLVFGDRDRRCWEAAFTCLDEPFVTDGAGCGRADCYVDLTNGYMFTTTCVPLTASRWRPCTQSEIASVADITNRCPPPYKAEGQFF